MFKEPKYRPFNVVQFSHILKTWMMHEFSSTVWKRKFPSYLPLYPFASSLIFAVFRSPVLLQLRRNWIVFTLNMSFHQSPDCNLHASTRAGNARSTFLVVISGILTTKFDVCRDVAQQPKVASARQACTRVITGHAFLAPTRIASRSTQQRINVAAVGCTRLATWRVHRLLLSDASAWPAWIDPRGQFLSPIAGFA